MTLTFHIPAVPVGQPRHRFQKATGRAYLPDSNPVHVFKALVALNVKAQYSGPLLTGPLGVAIECVFPRPKSRTTKRGPNPRYEHTSRPDADNIAKAVLDSLNCILWHDDAAVYRLVVEKSVAARGEPAHVKLIVTYQE
jgi:Holliday junction resolvase RusA-like endonuclease